MRPKNIVILGGGSGGTATAAELGRRVGRDHQVIVVDRQLQHVYMPALLMVMTGDRRAHDITRDLSRLARHNVQFLPSTVHGIDTDRQVLHLDGRHLPYDYLVVSLGLETHPDLIPGAREAAHHAWELPATLRLNAALRTFSGGRIVVGLSPGPYRCPPAPYETLYSLHQLLERQGLRDRTEIHYFSPIVRPSTTEDTVIGWLNQHAEERGVTTHYGFTVREVDPDGKRVVSDDGQTLDFDLLFIVPPHRPSQVLLDSGLSDQSGIKVDPDTLTTRWENVWAIGDAVDFPASKAGVVAHQQADVVANNLAVRVTGRGHEERLKLHTT